MKIYVINEDALSKFRMIDKKGYKTDIFLFDQEEKTLICKTATVVYSYYENEEKKSIKISLRSTFIDSVTYINNCTISNRQSGSLSYFCLLNSAEIKYILMEDKEDDKNDSKQYTISSKTSGLLMTESEIERVYQDSLPKWYTLNKLSDSIVNVYLKNFVNVSRTISYKII